MHLLLSFNDFWAKVQTFFHEMNQIVKILIISIFMLLALLSIIRFLKPKYSADKNKFKVLPLVLFAIFLGLACFVIFI
ncbi:MAG: hypothetical protein MR024_02550 [Firmicutes bacterium]|nr:hypothetical protein [Bacillota bacterium]